MLKDPKIRWRSRTFPGYYSRAPTHVPRDTHRRLRKRKRLLKFVYVFSEKHQTKGEGTRHTVQQTHSLVLLKTKATAQISACFIPSFYTVVWWLFGKGWGGGGTQNMTCFTTEPLCCLLSSSVWRREDCVRTQAAFTLFYGDKSNKSSIKSLGDKNGERW